MKAIVLTDYRREDGSFTPTSGARARLLLCAERGSLSEAAAWATKMA